MSARVFTAAVRISVYDDINSVWGAWTDEKQLLTLEMSIPEPTRLEFKSSAPDDTFGNTLSTYIVPGGSPQVALSSQDVINRVNSPPEQIFQELAMAARRSTLDVDASTDTHFTGLVDTLDRSIWSGIRNISSTIDKPRIRAALDGLMTGSIASADTTTATVTSAGWTVDELIGSHILITSGTGKGEATAITDNDATTVTVASWTTQPDSTSTFAIVEATDLIPGTDYSVDTKYGMIKALSTGAITAGEYIHGFVDGLAIDGTRFKGGTRQSVTWQAMGPGKDLISGDEAWLHVPKVVSYATDAVNFVTDAANAALQVATLSGTVQIDTDRGYDAPYLFDDSLTYGT